MTSAALIPFASGLALAAAWDVRQRRIPNAIVLALLAGGLFARLLAGGAAAAAWGFAGTTLGAGILLPAFVGRLVGGGDVKLLAAVGMWLGPPAMLEAALVGLALGGCLGLAMALASRGLRRDVATNLVLMTGGVPVRPERRPPGQTVPLGAALAAGALTVALVAGGLPHA